MQESAFVDDKYQTWRSRIVDECHEQIMALNTSLVSVKLNLKYVEYFKDKKVLTVINESEKADLEYYIAPLVYNPEQDEYAKRFDNFMYGLMLAQIGSLPSFKHAKNELIKVSESLQKQITIPQIKAKLTEIKQIETDAYWDAEDIWLFEQTRETLRGLIRFLADEKGPGKAIVTSLTDPIIDQQEGNQLDAAYDFEDYRKKVSRYVHENGHMMSIHKLTHNLPLSQVDYEELERILTVELGTKEDYEREYGDIPFGLLIRRIAKLDHEAAMEAFSVFINDASLNQRQIDFVHKIINHIEQNGYMENITDLQKPPFDKPTSFIKLFDPKKQVALVKTIQSITENATEILA